MKKTRNPSLPAVLLSMLFLLIGSARAEEVQFSAIMANGPYFLTERWAPVRVQITNPNDKPIEGEVEYPFDGLTERIIFRQPVYVPPKSSLRTVGVIYIPQLKEVTVRKGEAPPPMCMAVLRDKGGGMVARCPLNSRPLTDDSPLYHPSVRIDGPFIMPISAPLPVGSLVEDTQFDPSVFATMFQTGVSSRVIALSGFDASLAPRDRLIYDSVGMITLHGAAVDQLDALQQKALIEFVTMGGTVVLAGPTKDPSATWIAPYLPAQWVGTRAVVNVPLKSGKLKTTSPLELAEWIADSSIPDAQVVLADDQFVHGAYRQIGMGRLIVTSFPLAGLDPKDPKVREVWGTLFPERGGIRWETSKLSQQQEPLLESMIGLTTPKWVIAAAIVGAYVLVVLGIQLFSGAERRPTAFVIAIGVAVALAIGLACVSFFRDKTEPFRMARLTVLDLRAGGVRTEAVSMLGPQQDNLEIKAPVGASLKQAASEESKPLDLTIGPMKANRAAIYPKRIERVWQTQTSVPADQSLRVTGQFDENGLTLTIDNSVGKIQSPMLVRGLTSFSLPEIAEGKSTIRVEHSQLNPTGVMMNQRGVQLADDQLRGRILSAAMSRAQSGLLAIDGDPRFYIAGWMEQPPEPMIKVASESSDVILRGHALVRTPVEFNASPVGTKIFIPGAMVARVNSQLGAVPMSLDGSDTIETVGPNEFAIGFSYPWQIGKLKPDKVRFSMLANLPAQTITVRKGQSPGGIPTMNSSGPEAGKWTNPIGTTGMEIEIEPNDIDANGWVWLLFSIETPSPESRWSMKDLRMDYEGTIAGVPQQPIPPPRPKSDEPKPSKPAPPKKAAATKPAATKPATTKPAAPKKDTKPKATSNAN